MRCAELLDVLKNVPVLRACDANGDGVVNNADVLRTQTTLLGDTCEAPPPPSVTPSFGGCGIGPELSALLLPLLVARRWRAQIRRSRPCQ